MSVTSRWDSTVPAGVARVTINPAMVMAYTKG